MQHNLDGRKSLNSVFRSLLSSASSQSSLRYTRVNQDGTITSKSILCIHKSEANIFCWTDGISRIALLELLKGLYPLCSNPFGKWFGIWFWVPKHRTSQGIIKLIGCRFATFCFGWKKPLRLPSTARAKAIARPQCVATCCWRSVQRPQANRTKRRIFCWMAVPWGAGEKHTKLWSRIHHLSWGLNRYPCIVGYIRGGAEWYNFLQFLA